MASLHVRKELRTQETYRGGGGGGRGGKQKNKEWKEGLHMSLGLESQVSGPHRSDVSDDAAAMRMRNNQYTESKLKTIHKDNICVYYTTNNSLLIQVLKIKFVVVKNVN